MEDLNMPDSLATVGAFILYKNKLIFMTGPDKSGKKLGIMRFGGHIENNEDCYTALNRELKEEASISIKLIDSPETFYKTKWDAEGFEKLKDVSMPVKPLIIAGDSNRSTAVFLAYTEDMPIPSSESHAVIFLNEQSIKEICTRQLLLKDFAAAGGKLIFQKKLSENMEIYAGPHLRFLHELIENNNQLIQLFLQGRMK